MDNIPSEVKKNTIFIFTSDHGEYGSSHGLHGKGGTVYEEGIRVPLVVYDPTGVYTKFKDDPRNQLTSSVDLLPMIVTIGYGGDKNLWMRGEYKELYDKRCDLLPILGSPVAQGREFLSAFIRVKNRAVKSTLTAVSLRHLVGFSTLGQNITFETDITLEKFKTTDDAENIPIKIRVIRG